MLHVTDSQTDRHSDANKLEPEQLGFLEPVKLGFSNNCSFGVPQNAQELVALLAVGGDKAQCLFTNRHEYQKAADDEAGR